MKILVVSGAANAASRVAEPLREAGFTIESADAPGDADALLRVSHYDVLVIDLEDDASVALEWLRSLRQRRVHVPALVLTAGGAVDTRIAAIDAGADDYLAGEFESRELVARCRGLTRRRDAAVADDVVVCGELVIDSRKREVRHGSVPVDLTPREWSILEHLVQHVGTPVTKDRLMHAITGFDEQLAPNAIEVYVSRLRGKLAGTGARISTLRGVGYRLEKGPDSASAARSNW